MNRQQFASSFILTSVNAFLLVTLFAFLAAPLSSAFAQPVSDSLSEKVDAYLRETMRRFPIPGLAVGIVKGDQVIYLHGYGTANVNSDPVTPQTPFILCSVTKTFTALAIHQLVAVGKIDLDASVQTYIPEFRFADQSASTTITVQHLLDHTSGISQLEGEQPYLQSPKSTLEEAIKKLTSYTPTDKPGDNYEYSNWNFVLLGEIISRTGGMPYTEYVQKNILDLLEMTHAGFDYYGTFPNAATGNMIVFGVPIPYNEKYVPVLLGASNLSASTEEITHYLVAYFNPGQYHNQTLLPVRGGGWYDITWNWQVGKPDSSTYQSFSGSHVASQTNITLFPFYKVGVVIQMNTRLEQLSPSAPGAWDIAYNIARITMNSPSELFSNRGFYITWALIDSFLILLIVSIIWQAFNFRKWQHNYQTATHSKRIAAWFGIVFNFLLCIGFLAFPYLLNSRWNIILFHRPDFAIPFLTIGMCFGILGFGKVIRKIR